MWRRRAKLARVPHAVPWGTPRNVVLLLLEQGRKRILTDAIRRASRFMPGPGLGGHTGRLGTTAAKRIRLFPAQYPAAKAPIVTATAVAAAVAQSFSKNAAEKGESASSIADILIPMYVGVTGVAGGCGGCSSVG